MQDLLLLHGAIGAKDQFDLLAQSLKETFKIHQIDFSGHGGAAMPDEFSIQNFAADILVYCYEQKLTTINIFGYSMGGYVALYLAKHHPQIVFKVFTFGTKFLWTPEIAQLEIKMLDAKKISEKIPMFAKQLEIRHGAQWQMVLEKTARMLEVLGNFNPLEPADFMSITQPILIGIGDKDTMVSIDETIAAYKNLPNGNLIVFPNTPHPFDKIDLVRLKNEIIWFFRTN